MKNSLSNTQRPSTRFGNLGNICDGHVWLQQNASGKATQSYYAGACTGKEPALLSVWGLKCVDSKAMMQQPWGGAERILLASTSLLSPGSSSTWRAKSRKAHRYPQSNGEKTLSAGTAWIWMWAFWHTPIIATVWFSGFFCAASRITQIMCVYRADCLSLRLVTYSEQDMVANLLQ